MKNTALKNSTQIVFVFALLFFVFAQKAHAQIFILDPSAATKNVGEEFTVNLNIDTQGKAVAQADVKLTFDSTILEVVRVDKGDFFPDGGDYVGAGTLYVGGFLREQYVTKNGSGKLATVTLKGKTAGSSLLSFTCSTQTIDSNIFDSSANDVINCSGIQNGSYTITGGSSLTETPTLTPTPTTGSGSSPTSTPVPISTPSSSGGEASQPTPTPPTTGVFSPTIFFGAGGILLTIFGIALVFIVI